MGLVITSGIPRAMPERDDGLQPFASASFDPAYQQAVAPTRGGRPQVANLGSDLWVMSFETHPLRYDDALDYLAWLQSLRGGARLFKAWHPHLRYPLNYRNGFAGMTRVGGGSFDGTCTIDSVGETLDTLTLTTLPDAFILKRGDMISMPFGSSQTLHRIIAGATANSFGAATVTVEPTIPISFATSPEVTATLVKPWCLAVVDANSIKGPFQSGQFGTVSFSAVQTY